MERNISITFSSSSDTSWFLTFYNVESDCTDAQISSFAGVCGSATNGSISSVQVTDVRNVEV